MPGAPVAKDGFHHHLDEELYDLDPRFAEAYEQLHASARRRAALSEVERELIGLALNAAVTHLNRDAAARHLAHALEAGATRGQVLETLQMASVLGIHSVTVGLPIILEEMGIEMRQELTASQAAAQQEFIRRRGSWSDLWDSLIRVDEEFFAAYTEFSGVPWDNEEGLSHKTRELIYVAIDAATNHLMQPGIRGHARNAIKYGATLEEFLEVLELTALIGMQAYIAGIERMTPIATGEQLLGR